MRRCLVVVVASLLASCSDDPPANQEFGTTGGRPDPDTSSSAETGSDEGTTDGGTTSSSDGDSGSTSSTSTGAEDDGPPPPVLYDVGGGQGSETGIAPTDCDDADNSLLATIRDFKSTHVDFEAFWGSAASTGLVLPDLGPDLTPQYNPTPPFPPPGSSSTQITSATSFAEWYHDTPGVNAVEEFTIELQEMPPDSGIYVFDDATFFPVDDLGWNTDPLGPDYETFPDTLGDQHNFHFTTEIHTSFIYRPGQVFTFTGDDDLWVFVDGTLQIDLGGLHGNITGSVDMDTLGLTEGETYPLDIFHAERRHDASHFRMETSIECFLTPEG